MPAFDRVLWIVPTLFATAWGVAVLASAAVAANAFPIMKDLQPTLAAFAGYEADHWPIAAGAIANRMFIIADAVQLLAAISVGSSFIMLVLRRSPAPRIASIVRWLAYGLALVALGIYLFWLRPKMDVDLAHYWDAARAGDAIQAEARRQAFNQRHPTATALMGTTALATLVLAVATAWCATASTRDAAR